MACCRQPVDAVVANSSALHINVALPQPAGYQKSSELLRHAEDAHR